MFYKSPIQNVNKGGYKECCIASRATSHCGWGSEF